MGQVDTGNFRKRLGQNIGLIFVSRDGFGNHIDVHAAELLSRLSEPLHLLELFFLGQSRVLERFIHPLFSRLTVLIGADMQA